MTATIPPPTSPPAIAEESSSASAPTFLELWREREKKKPPVLTQASFMEYFSKQLLFPRHIPETALCDVGPILSLVSRHGEAVDESSGKDGTFNNAALDSLRSIASQCATYKDKAVLNHNEFQHKRSVELREQLEQEEDDDTTGNGTSSDAITIVQQPPYHPEYTPLPVPGNYLLSKIHGANYNICLAKAACPHQTRRLLACWKSADPEWVKTMEQKDMEEHVCAEEREGVERCIGLSVQRVMKELLG